MLGRIFLPSKVVASRILTIAGHTTRLIVPACRKYEAGHGRSERQSQNHDPLLPYLE